MRAQTMRRRTVINWDQAVSLLYPIAVFLDREGMSKSQSLAALAAAMDDVAKPAGKRLEHIGAPNCYADLIAVWIRERRFLDSRGRPRRLPLSGANGFAALARTVCPGQDSKRLLNVLIRYKNVRRLRNGRLQLVSPFFCATAGSNVAFEPVAYFLRDAASALTHVLKNSNTRTLPHHFWRMVENANISRSNARKFCEFARERSLIFLEEMDDWLQAHSHGKPSNERARSRVGLGLFSIYSH
jgi:hypothetical protein